MADEDEQVAPDMVKATEKGLTNCCGYEMDYLGRSQYRCRLCGFDLDYS